MRAGQSKWAKRFFRNEKNSRQLLKELTKNDKLDGKSITTSFGLFKKIS
jgi:hypothetical protein